MDKKEIEEKIARLKKFLNDEGTSAEEKKRIETGLKRLEDMLETGSKADDSGKEEEESKKKAEPKAKAEPKPKKEEPAPKPEPTKKPIKGKKMIEVDGKEYEENSPEFCAMLVEKFKERRAKAKERNAQGKKTTSVMSRIAEHVEKGIATAIKSGVKENEDKIEKNPALYIKKLEKLEATTKTFLQELKDVLGAEYDAKEVTETTKAIHDLVEKLKASIQKK